MSARETVEAAARPVAVLFGGVSSEHPVSLKSGTQIVKGLVAGGFEVIPVVIGKDGVWSLVPIEAALRGYGDEVRGAAPGALVFGDALETTREIKRRGADVVVLGLHGPGGEDGVLQGFLEIAGLKYTGPGVAASAVAMDKLLLKRVLRGAGLPTADWIEFEADDFSAPRREATLLRAEAWATEEGWPVVAKARSLGSSVGVAVVPDAASLRKSMLAVVAEGAGVFLERGLKGVEVSCASFGLGAEAVALPAIEIVPQKAAWFDFESKYAPGGSLERIPAQIAAKDEKRVREIAVAVHRLIGADGVTRTDMIVTTAGPVVLETNTLPGMTETSLVPQEAKAIGWSFEELLRRMVANARARRA
jgi:D-alanine-D-alanine ligase